MAILKVPGLQKPCSTDLIIWIEGDGNYVWIHFVDRPKFLSAQTLKWFARQLPGFLRVHKSSLVNSDHLVQFKRTHVRQAKVILSNGVTLLVSRRRVQPIADQLGI
ncbi:LytR/AlgR family response regulator transcription factor [Spirosoma pollinicola]|uniref:LytTR family transcriptional regulator n=1 Tax=Spirosoma pollinicola TaxID=2057025 RepID=A0A2K8Z891_9BACT|nr:LytTR family DNA-binding domain-containing protein [Spirosoma pollinicola]AUD06070.1 LytTR family transcriptional regulator [Spirosoma pollinicola]